MLGSINVIKYHGGLVANDPLWIELWTAGFSTILVKKKEDVELIQSILKDWRNLVNRTGTEDDDEKTYLTYVLKNEYGW